LCFLTLRLPEHNRDSKRYQHANEREEKYARVAVKPKHRADQWSGKKEGDVGKGGEDAEGRAAIVPGDALDRFNAEGGKDEREAEAGKGRRR
jgi:hypothetical protein